MANNSLLLLGGLAAVAYVTRNSWLPAVEGAGATGATGNNPLTPTTSTANLPISASVPGAVALGNGCFGYPNNTDNGMVINCPPGVSPPAAAAPANASQCSAGFTFDAAGICTRYPDAVLIAQLNSIPWTSLSDIPAEQLQRIQPQTLDTYSTINGIMGGTVLAYMLGLGANPVDGTVVAGTDGNAYKALSGVFYRQGTATGSTVNGVRMGRLGTVSAITAALPITPATLIMASVNPHIAQLVGRDQRAMLTAAQWNGLYTQATGIVQGIPVGPHQDLMSAEQYQAYRRARGLEVAPANLGTLRPARRRAFPLAGLGLINQWVPPGNRTIFQIPGRGAVPAGRGGKVPPRKLGLITDGGGMHRWARSPFPRPEWWREAEGNPVL